MSGAPARIVIKIMLQIIAVVCCYLLDAENRKYCSTAIGQEEKMQDAVFQRIGRSVVPQMKTKHRHRLVNKLVQHTPCA